MGPSYAANPVTMEVSSPLALTDKPFSVQVRFRRWFPIAVTLSNTGEPVKASLTLKLSSSGGEQGATSTFTTEVDLPTVARKRVWLYGRVERGESDQATVSLRGPGIETIENKFDLRTPDAGTRVLLTISDSDEKLSYLSTLDNRRLGVAEEMNNANFGISVDATRQGVNPNQTRRYVSPLGKSHEWIPERAIGLDAVDAIVLQDFPHTALSPLQLTALRGYVASGGTLVVLGGAQWQRLSSSPLADLWPVTPAASSPASASEVLLLVNNYVTQSNLDAGDRLGGAPVILTRSRMKPDAALVAGTSSAPLITLSRSGAGQVIFLAMDPTQPPFLGWSGLGELWATVFAKTKRVSRIESVDARLEMPGYSPTSTNRYPYGSPYQILDVSADSTANLASEMVKSPQLRTPPVSYIAWFLALYVFVLVPVNYCVLRYFDRRELAWVSVPVIVLAFSLISYFAALRIKGSIVRTRHVNIVQGALNSGVARADTIFWLFSPRKSTYEIVASDPQVVAAPYLDGVRDNTRDEATIWQPPTNAPFTVRDTMINMWDYKSFVGQAVVNIGSGVTVRPKGDALEIVNNSNTNLHGVVLVNGGHVLAYGDLRAGQSTSQARSREGSDTVEPSLRGAVERVTEISRIYPPDGSNAYQKMAQGALSLALGSQFGKSNQGLMLIAWAKEPLTRLSAAGEDPESQDVTLWVLRAPEGLKVAASLANSQQAVVRLVDSETVMRRNQSRNVYGNDEILPRIHTYEGEFADAARLDNVAVSLSGLIQNSYSSYTYDPYAGRNEEINRRTLKPVSRVEMWNFQQRRWQTLSGQSTKAANRTGWSWNGTLAGGVLQQCLRRPDNLVRLRVLVPHGIVKINSLRLASS
jgi:hypothetical protein